MESQDFANNLNRPPATPQATGQTIPPVGTIPVSTQHVRGWPRWASSLRRWAPYAAVAWSLAYAALGIAWLLSKRGFPYASPVGAGEIGSLIAMFGPAVAWIIVLLAGLPAAGLGLAMLRPERSRTSERISVLRPLFILGGALLSATLMLFMTSINLLMKLAYLPLATVKLVAGAEFGPVYFQSLIAGPVLHELLCLAGGFLWLAATISYSRRSSAACLVCGRRESAEPGQEGWRANLTSPASAARWGRIAVLVALLVPLFYAVTRYAWALGTPLGITAEQLRAGQADGSWISGLFLANVGLVGGILMLGLVMRWGEVFPRWMPGLAGRRVPVALAVIPAALMSVLLTVGGIAIWANYAWMADAAAAAGLDMGIVVGPVALFPVWGVALALATLAYYYRRRGPCRVCGRGAAED